MGLPYLGIQNILRRHHDTWPTLVEVDPVDLTCKALPYGDGEITVRLFPTVMGKSDVLSSTRCTRTHREEQRTPDTRC